MEDYDDLDESSSNSGMNFLSYLSKISSPNSSFFAAVSATGPQSLYDQLKKEVTDRGMEVKETLKKFQGKVFHAVNTTHGTMLRYR